jgi:two-component system chemotaxis response regulator CheB
MSLSIAPTPAAERTGPFKVMVVDDSFVIRALLSRTVEDQKDMEVVVTAGNGQIAVNELKKREIDVIILDIEMPVMDGLTAIPFLLQADPHVQIIVASTLTHKNAEISMKAIKAGATDYLSKPSTSSEMSGADQFKHDLVEKVREFGALSRRNRQRNPDLKTGAALTSSAFIPQKKELVLQKNKNYPRPEIIAIGCSTGGPQALFNVLASLKGQVRQPIVITQHMPPTFTSILANHITQQTGITAVEGAEDMRVEPGKIYVAPGDFHMTFIKEALGLKIKLEKTPPVNFCRPAVDVMLKSLVDIYQSRILAVILTGLGSDGKNGCMDIFEKGGAVLAQDETTSVVWGMPGAVAQAGICANVLPISHLANHIIQMAR